MILPPLCIIFAGAACPHTRGDDPDVLVMSEALQILVPTRVGMILGHNRIKKIMRPCPHTRGDDPKLK